MLNYTNATTSYQINMSMPLDIIIYGSIFYSLICILGVSGNLSVIYVLLRDKELRNFTNYLLANLSMADLMVLFTCVPSALHDLFAKERWYLGKVMCHLIAFIENCMGNASILSIFLITIERYYVICRPLKVKSVMTQSRTLHLIALIWLVSISINLPFIFLTEYKLVHFYDSNTTDYKCITRSPNTLSFSYFISVTFVIYVVIGIVLLGMYYKISQSLKKSTKLLMSSANKRSSQEARLNTVDSLSKRNSTFEETDFQNAKYLYPKSNNFRLSQISFNLKSNQLEKLININTMNNLNSNLERYVKPRKQLILMLMCVIVVFYVCLFPLKVWNLTLMFVGHKPYFPKIITLRYYWYISITARIFFYMNSFINPILYNSLSKKFRNAFGRLCFFRLVFGCCMSPSSSGFSDNDVTKHSFFSS